jgi:predicted ester cyclase
MSAEETKAVITTYLDALLANKDLNPYLADDVRIEIVGAGAPTVGRDEVAKLIAYMHGVAFQSQVELKGLTVSDGSAAAELVFRGKHVGEMLGIAATGRSVTVPYTAVYDLRGDKVSAIRVYGLGLLFQQLTASGATPA